MWMLLTNWAYVFIWVYVWFCESVCAVVSFIANPHKSWQRAKKARTLWNKLHLMTHISRYPFGFLHVDCGWIESRTYVFIALYHYYYWFSWCDQTGATVELYETVRTKHSLDIVFEDEYHLISIGSIFAAHRLNNRNTYINKNHPRMFGVQHSLY